MPALFGATLFGLFSKESALCIVPLVPFAALVAVAAHAPASARCAGSRGDHGGARHRGGASSSTSSCAGGSSRRPSPTSTATRPSPPSTVSRASTRLVLRWYAQPACRATRSTTRSSTRRSRSASRARCASTSRGLGQVLLPLHLSGDYSAPQEPIPATRRLSRERARGARVPGAARRLGVAPHSGLGPRGRRQVRRHPEVRHRAGDRSRAGRRRRPGLDRRLVLPRVEHPDHPADGARRAILVLPGDRHERAPRALLRQGHPLAEATSGARISRRRRGSSSARSCFARRSSRGATPTTTPTTSCSGTRRATPSPAARRRTSTTP